MHLLSAEPGALPGSRGTDGPQEPGEQSAVLDRRARSVWGYLRQLGAPDLPANSHPIDPGHDPYTLAGHLAQSSHLMASLQISNACWLVARQESTREKIAAARRRDVPIVTDSGPFEIALRMGKLEEYLALCADMGVSRVEAGPAGSRGGLMPRQMVRRAADLGLAVQFKFALRRGMALAEAATEGLISRALTWLDAGAESVVVGATLLFSRRGMLSRGAADRCSKALGLERLVFEAPSQASQVALIRHLGREVGLGRVRLEDLLGVETFRRGLYAEAFDEKVLRRDTSVAPGSRSEGGAHDRGRAGSGE